MRDHKAQWWNKLSTEEREKERKARQERQASLMKKFGVELDYWGPAWGAEHDYVTVVKSDKAWDEMGSFIGQWNEGWVKTKTIAVTIS